MLSRLILALCFTALPFHALADTESALPPCDKGGKAFSAEEPGPEPACRYEWTDFGETFYLDYIPFEDGDQGASWRLSRVGSGIAQTFTGFEYPAWIVDIDGDGWRDVGMLMIAGMVNSTFDMHRFDVDTQRFVSLGELSNWAYRDVDGLIVSGGRSSCCAWGYEFFALDGNTLVPQFEMSVEPTDPDGDFCKMSAAPGMLRPHPRYARAPVDTLASEAMLDAYCGHYEEAKFDDLRAREAYQDSAAFWNGLTYCDRNGREAATCMASFTGFADCAAEAPTTSGIALCAEADHAVWDERLNEVYARLRAPTRPAAFRDGLRVAQRGWIAMRDADCGLGAASGATGAPAERWRQTCLRARTAQRVLDLWRLEQGFDDLTGP
ncbi:lysozyme inhibitor LprI family protein [Aestuariibius sp. 2305UL40-4]|uniref:lysozyme inhibitor LprI family protein n=1 Tax=Aestuariibius violaceus TaxID=3234132 RepID=UPI00345F0B22